VILPGEVIGGPGGGPGDPPPWHRPRPAADPSWWWQLPDADLPTAEPSSGDSGIRAGGSRCTNELRPVVVHRDAWTANCQAEAGVIAEQPMPLS
jgi:hypothetical protein